MCAPNILNWEANKGAPQIRFMPAIVRFLGCNPLPQATTLGEQLIRHLTALGLSRERAALELGVDAGTLARWERGERVPTGEFLGRVDRFLGDESALKERIRLAG